MKNRTIAKLLVCSTILANLPVAAMASEVQALAADNNVWSNEGKDWTYTLNSDTNLWGNEEGTYKLDSDSTYKILFDTAVNVGLDSNVETDDTTSKLTIEGKSASESNFNLNGYTITGDVTFKNVNVVGTVDRANTYVDETVTINQMAVVTVTGAENVTITNESGDFANGAGLALVGDTLTIVPADGYTVTVTGANATEVENQYTVTGAVTVAVQEAAQDVWVEQADGSYVLDATKLTGTELVVPASTATTTYTIKSGTVLDVNKVEVGKGSILRVEQGATFNQDVDFVLGGRLIAQTTTFKGQVWFFASMVREASATTDGTAVVDGATFEKAVTISVPTELTGATTANAEVAVAGNATLTVSGSVVGTGSIASQGILEVTANSQVEVPITVAAGTATVDGTASKVVVTGDATLVLGSTSNVGAIEAEKPENVIIEDGANYNKFGIQFSGANGHLEYAYGGNAATSVQDGENIYIITKDASVPVSFNAVANEGYRFSSLTINGQQMLNGSTYDVTGDVTVAAVFASTSGGGGSAGGGGGAAGGGSSSTGTTSTVTVSATTSVSGNVMSATVSAANMEKAVKEVLALAEKNDTTPVVKVSLNVGVNIEGISVNLPTEALKALAAVSSAKLTIESSVATVTFDAAALSDILSQAGETFTLNAGKADMSNFTAAQLLGAGEGSVFDINITSGETGITNFSKGTATVTLPYTLKVDENASDIVVYYMADNGILDSQSTQYDAANRKATFTTNHFSIYVVDAAWANPFNDVAEGDWFYNAVRYANENSLMAGVSDTTFAPNMNLTRAMVVQMLYSLEGKPAVVSGGNFTDVKASDWYADAVNWAASKGIVSGYSETTYAPNDSVTREQLSLILYKYAQSKNVTVNDYSSLSGFVDAAKTSDWAEDAVEWAVGAGLISSTSTSNKTLDPTGTATRAQVAQIVANFVEQVM